MNRNILSLKLTEHISSNDSLVCPCFPYREPSPTVKCDPKIIKFSLRDLHSLVDIVEPVAGTSSTYKPISRVVEDLLDSAESPLANAVLGNEDVKIILTGMQATDMIIESLVKLATSCLLSDVGAKGIRRAFILISLCDPSAHMPEIMAAIDTLLYGACKPMHPFVAVDMTGKIINKSDVCTRVHSYLKGIAIAAFSLVMIREGNNTAFIQYLNSLGLKPPLSVQSTAQCFPIQFVCNAAMAFHKWDILVLLTEIFFPSSVASAIVQSATISYSSAVVTDIQAFHTSMESISTIVQGTGKQSPNEVSLRPVFVRIAHLLFDDSAQQWPYAVSTSTHACTAEAGGPLFNCIVTGRTDTAFLLVIQCPWLMSFLSMNRLNIFQTALVSIPPRIRADDIDKAIQLLCSLLDNFWLTQTKEDKKTTEAIVSAIEALPYGSSITQAAYWFLLCRWAISKNNSFTAAITESLSTVPIEKQNALIRMATLMSVSITIPNQVNGTYAPESESKDSTAHSASPHIKASDSPLVDDIYSNFRYQTWMWRTGCILSDIADTDILRRMPDFISHDAHVAMESKIRTIQADVRSDWSRILEHCNKQVLLRSDIGSDISMALERAFYQRDRGAAERNPSNTDEIAEDNATVQQNETLWM